MKNCTAIVLFSIVCIKSVAQVELKLYQNTDFYTVAYNSSIISSALIEHYVKFSRISLAVSLQRKKVTHELELFVPDINKPIKDVSYPMNYELDQSNGNNTDVRSYSLRYEVSKIFYHQGGLSLGLGAGINPYYVKFSYISTASNVFNRYLWYTGAALNVVPHISYSLASKVRIDLSIPLKVFDIRNARQKIENPSIPIRQQENGGWENKFFENAYTIRLGLGVKI